MHTSYLVSKGTYHYQQVSANSLVGRDTSSVPNISILLLTALILLRVRHVEVYQVISFHHERSELEIVQYLSIM